MGLLRSSFEINCILSEDKLMEEGSAVLGIFGMRRFCFLTILSGAIRRIMVLIITKCGFQMQRAGIITEMEYSSILM